MLFTVNGTRFNSKNQIYTIKGDDELPVSHPR